MEIISQDINLHLTNLPKSCQRSPQVCFFKLCPFCAFDPATRFQKRFTWNLKNTLENLTLSLSGAITLETRITMDTVSE